ncbi:MAG: hypothetical protein KDA35_00300 [Hyphomonadaceae bacterium]|nr:hypothetical protein [Hyphomonadaceae bacterium]
MSTLLEEEAMTRPAQRWRNFYWLAKKMLINGEMRGPGRTPSKFVWPSRDIAETMAEKRRHEWEKVGVKYLGAEKEF